jgi:predicted RNA-binding protein with EMAP domain
MSISAIFGSRPSRHHHTEFDGLDELNYPKTIKIRVRARLMVLNRKTVRRGGNNTADYLPPRSGTTPSREPL